MKSNLTRVVAMMEARLLAGNEALAIAVESEAKRRAPVDTGRLRASITHDSDATGAIVGTNVEYAPFQELGTSKMQAQPFLVPAAMGIRPHVSSFYGA